MGVEKVCGDFDGDQRAAAGVTDDVEGGLRAVEHFEALLHVLHADAGAVACEPCAGSVAHAYAVVGHLDEDAIAGEFAAQGDGAAVYARLESMLDAVFDERLEQDAGDENVERLRIDFFFDM